MRKAALLIVPWLLLAACGDSTVTIPDPDPPTATVGATLGRLTIPTTREDQAYFRWGSDGRIAIDAGGDVDWDLVLVHDNPPLRAVRSGNGEDLAGDGVADAYLRFRVPDDLVHEGQPTTRLVLSVEYLDAGTDTFNIQYDAVNEVFKNSAIVRKTDTGTYKTADIHICDAHFGNRAQGADFRIADHAPDGPEVIQSITVTRSPATAPQISVDSCGANPFDGEPDSDAIQSCIDLACDGDTVLFTSGGGDPNYRGYLIDKTIFLARTGAKAGLAFTSTDAGDHALLAATPDLAGFVVRLYARSAIGPAAGAIDDITFSHLDLDGNRGQRKCVGNNNSEDGIDDNWGSWLPECSEPGDPWCRPGGIAMLGRYDTQDPTQDYTANPGKWSTGLVVHDVTISNVECGTGLSYGGAAGTIDSVTIDTAGDHVHLSACAQTDADEPRGGWADGITLRGPAIEVTNNHVVDASDIGIVTFGGRDTIISNNTIETTAGNHGMFAGIAAHPNTFGLLSGFELTGNTVIDSADDQCGGIHAGINVGLHMWGVGCKRGAPPSAFGTNGACSATSPAPGPSPCDPSGHCRVWGYVPPGTTFELTGNSVTGAQVNYLVEGLDVRGGFDESGNLSSDPTFADWQSDVGCTRDGVTDTWTTHEFVAHDPVLPGWEDKRIYCER